MKKNRIFFIFILIAALLEATFLNYFRIFKVRPELILLGVVLASLYLDMKWALAVAVFAGILKDIFNLQAFGINTFLFPLWVFAVTELSRRISLDNNFIRTALILLVVIIQDITAQALAFSLTRVVIPSGIFLRTIILESLYTAAVFPLAFKIIKPALFK